MSVYIALQIMGQLYSGKMLSELPTITSSGIRSDMPKYDYKCNYCSVVIEIEHTMDETAEWDHCPRCEENGDPEQGGYLHKIFRPAATHFKGQGWGKVYRKHTPKKK